MTGQETWDALADLDSVVAHGSMLAIRERRSSETQVMHTVRFSTLAFFLSILAAAQESRPIAVSSAHLRAFESAAHQLARAGWREELERLVDVMKTLGYSEQDGEKLLTSCRKEVPKGKAPTPQPDVARSLRALALQAAKIVQKGSSGAETVAAAILTIDDSVESLHELLGHEKTAEGWKTPEQAKALARRGEIVAALTKARKLSPEVTIFEDDDAIFEELYKTKCTKVSASGMTLCSRWSGNKMKRVLLEALRAAALSNHLLGGELALPRLNHEFLLLDAEKDYHAAVDIAARRKWIDPKDVELTRKLSGFYPARGDNVVAIVGYEKTEAHAEAAALFTASGWLKVRDLNPPLRVGHLNWLCLSYLGTPMPAVVIEETDKKAGKTGSRTDDVEARMRLGEGGITGSRSWLSYLASQNQDPPFANSIVDQDGKIEGEDRVKCTFVVEFLQEHDELVILGEKTKSGRKEEFEQAWGGSFAGFETRWRRWLLGRPPSIVERIDPIRPRPLTKSEIEVLTQINQVRKQCFKGSICGDSDPGGTGDRPADLVDPYLEVTLDDSLSKGTRSHAAYLAKHKDQAASWPDAHEEWPDRVGFSPEGGWAAGHSVIAPGVSTPADALQGWLGTYYHRLPLIHPGLMRIGWGLEQNVAVMDCGSLARPLPGPWHVVWPFDGMRDVPTRFSPELPNPVPGADQERFGYPVTLQVGEHLDTTAMPSISIELREGSATGPLVECHVSTPADPSYPELPTPNAWCLIPKSHLRAGTTYFATAKWSNARKITWSFKTK